MNRADKIIKALNDEFKPETVTKTADPFKLPDGTKRKKGKVKKIKDAIEDAAKKVDLKKELAKAEYELQGAPEAGNYEFEINGYHVEIGINNEDIDSDSGSSLSYTVENAKGKEVDQGGIDCPNPDDEEADSKWNKAWSYIVKDVTKAVSKTIKDELTDAVKGAKKFKHNGKQFEQITSAGFNANGSAARRGRMGSHFWAKDAETGKRVLMHQRVLESVEEVKEEVAEVVADGLEKDKVTPKAPTIL